MVGHWKRAEVQESSLGDLSHLQGEQVCLTRGPVRPCLKCKGKGRIDEFGIGLLVVCDACGGALAEHQDHNADEPKTAIWNHPAVASLSVCRMCLGTGVVVNLGGLASRPGR